jgi:predicted dehydrogenase
MINTGLIGHGYWGKIIESKLDKISNKIFVQTSSNYDPAEFSKIDWIFIATPPSTHYIIAKDAINSRVNVFLEKPFCINTREAKNLIYLSKKNNVKLFIDNVFLYRKELENIPMLTPNQINFFWHKPGPYNDTLLNDLLYHDLYILYYLLGENIITDLIIDTNEINKLIFSLKYGNSKVNFNYYRNNNNLKVKKISIDDLIIDFKNNSEDPLLVTINNCINYKVDFIKNNYMNLKIRQIFDLLISKLE